MEVRQTTRTSLSSSALPIMFFALDGLLIPDWVAEYTLGIWLMGDLSVKITLICES